MQNLLIQNEILKLEQELAELRDPQRIDLYLAEMELFYNENIDDHIILGDSLTQYLQEASDYWLEDAAKIETKLNLLKTKVAAHTIH